MPYKDPEKARAAHKAYYERTKHNRDKVKHRETLRCWRKNNRERHQLQQRAYKYGITTEELTSIIVTQNNKCAICGSNEPNSKLGFHLDHNHITHEVRKLLCFNCNIGLGRFKDNPKFLRKAAEYLEEHNETETHTDDGRGTSG